MPYQRKELSDRLFSTLDRQDITMRTFSQTMIDVADTGINLPKNNFAIWKIREGNSLKKQP